MGSNNFIAGQRDLLDLTHHINDQPRKSLGYVTINVDDLKKLLEKVPDEVAKQLRRAFKHGSGKQRGANFVL